MFFATPCPARLSLDVTRHALHLFRCRQSTGTAKEPGTECRSIEGTGLQGEARPDIEIGGQWQQRLAGQMAVVVKTNGTILG